MIDRSQSLSANDRMKGSFTELLAGSLVAATALHFLVLTLWPAMEAPIWDDGTERVSDVIRFDKIDLPPAPDPMARPAAPVVAVDAPADATIEPVDFVSAGELPPPPPPDARVGADAGDPFVAFEVAPRLTNAEAFQRALQRAYPAALRDAGLGGVVVLAAFIDETGRVVEARVAGSSGYEALDEAALGLVDVMRFSPALNRDRRVAVWVELPVDFRVRD